MSIEIGRIRVRYRQSHNGIDTGTLRLRMAHCLDNAELHPSAMPPSAILMVRRLASPLPVQMALWPGASHRHASWEGATRQVLMDTYSRAVRPNQGYVPASAEAVAFADEGEMLACLALDMSRGQALEHWWWRTLLHTLPSSSLSGLTTLLCRGAAAVPAALHYLARCNQAVLVVQALSPDQAMAVFNAMGQAYGMADFRPGPLPLQGLSRAPADTPPTLTQAALRSELYPPDMATLPPTETGSEMRAAPPWEATLVPPHLRKERACLLGVGLSLYSWPSMVRSRVFLSHLRAWWAESAPVAGRSTLLPQRQEIGEIGGEVQAVTDLTLVIDHYVRIASQLSQAGREAKRLEKQGLGQEITLLSDTARDTVSSEIGPDARIRNGSEESTEPVSERHLHPLKTEVLLQADSKDEMNERLQTPATDRDQEPPTVGVRETALHLEHGIQTALGGVLYLINLMCQLDLPACFEAAWELDRQIGPWGILELLGRGLLASERRASSADPLWMVLSQLGRRAPGELPGAEVQGSDCFSLPVAWITPVSSGAEGYYWTMQHRWLRVWSDAGYVLAECPRSASPPAVQARAALQAYLAPGSRERLLQRTFNQAPLNYVTGPMVTGLNPSLVRWLALLLPFLRHRLQLALQPAATEAFDLAQMLLLYPGRLYVTATHVDLVMRLEEISLPVRLAGLDRNPGWLPDFGRVVLFHFE